MLKREKSIFFIILIVISGILILNSSFIKNSLSFLFGVTINKNIELKQNQDRDINLLLLGIGGGEHDGPKLSDTIIFVNIKPSKDEVNLISIPRDLWIPKLQTKINAAYAYGEEHDKIGILTSSGAVEKIVGKPINYTLVVDFSAFEKVVDILGGIDVNVVNTLDDYNYPLEGKETDTCGHSQDEIKEFTATVSAEPKLWDFFSCRYKHLHVDSGLIHMDGITALEFVRSRHAKGQEGTDFARSQRQHVVISAIKERALSLGIILNPIKIFDIYNVIKNNVDSDIKPENFDDFVKLFQKMKSAKINNYVIDMGDEKENRPGLLINPPLSVDNNYQWVLIPRVGNGNFSEINNYAKCIIDSKICQVTEKSVIISGKKEEVKNPNP